jgi:hypothetical protein
MIEMTAPGSVVRLTNGIACYPNQTATTTTPRGVSAASIFGGHFHIATVYQGGAFLDIFSPTFSHSSELLFQILILIPVFVATSFVHLSSLALFDPSNVVGTTKAVVSVSLGGSLSKSFVLAYGTTLVSDVPVMVALTGNRRRMVLSDQNATCVSLLRPANPSFVVSADLKRAIFVEILENPQNLRILDISSASELVARRVSFSSGASPAFPFLVLPLSFNPSNSSQYFFYTETGTSQAFWRGNEASADLVALSTFQSLNDTVALPPFAFGFSSNQTDSYIFYGCRQNSSFPLLLCRASYNYANSSLSINLIASFNGIYVILINSYGTFLPLLQI